MSKKVEVRSYKYDINSRHLKLFYTDGSGVIYKTVPEFVYQNLLRCHDKTAFVQKYLEYDLSFSKVTLIAA